MLLAAALSIKTQPRKKKMTLKLAKNGLNAVRF